MKAIQDLIRNRGALNLFDGKGVKPREFTAIQQKAIYTLLNVGLSGEELRNLCPDPPVYLATPNRRNLPAHSQLGKVKR